MAKDMAQLLEQYMDQERMHNMEGRKGMEHMCQIAGALGYKDPMYFGQLTRKATVGDLLLMLQDNPGMIEAMLDWLSSKDMPEMRESLAQCVQGGDDEEEDSDNE